MARRRILIRRILLTLGYLVLALVLAVGTFVLVAYGNDYSYDFQTHRIIQDGHIILASLPNGLRVKADGKLLKKKTPYQAPYKVGLHSFSLAKEGYYTWEKTMKVVAGLVTQARYIVLVPTHPKLDTLDTRGQIVAESISKDHRHLAYVTGGTDPGVYTLDIGNPRPVKLYSPTPDPAAPETVSGVTWSDDASHLLVVSMVNGSPVHRVLAAGGGEPVNLTAKYGLTFGGVQFSAANWKQLYWISPEGLRRVDLDASSVSGVLADNVQQFWVQPDRVLYVQQTPLGRSLWSVDGRGHHQELIQGQFLAQSDSYSVAYVNYQGDDELAVVPASTQVATLWTDAFGANPASRTIAHNVTTASFSPSGQFLVLYSPTTMVTYDLEQSQVFQTVVSYTVADQPGNLQALSWFDNFHLLAVRDGKLYWSEYDGANRVELGHAYGALPAYATSDLRSVLSYRPDGQNVKLVQIGIKP